MRRTPVFVAGLLFAGLAFAARPFDDDVLGDIGMLPAGGLSLLAASIYFGLIILAGLAPRKHWLVMPLAFCWPWIALAADWLLRR